MDLKKDKKRLQLHLNKIHGFVGEKLAEGDMIASGKKFKRSPKGQDYEYYNTDDLGRKIGTKKYLEVKTNNARKSKLQDKKSKSKGINYKVKRYQI